MIVEKLIPPQDEETISSFWKYKEKVYISIVCITFNQADYIADALDSFLSQQCEYRFEIVVHDDCSSDRTKEILEYYQTKYPSIINLVIQKENQYSKGKKITPIAVSYSDGEYIAVCEGDDYWVSYKKLQDQIREMLNHKSCDISFHPAYKIENNLISIFGIFGSEVSIIDSERVITGGGGMFSTASIMLKKSFFESLPSWFYDIAPVGDKYAQMLGALKGGALYVPGINAAYRYKSKGSWTSSTLSVSEDYITEFLNRDLYCLDAILELSPENKKSIKTAKAKSFYHAASLSLTSKHYDLFQALIKRSVKDYGVHSKSQLFYYHFRKFPVLIKFVKKIFYFLKFTMTNTKGV